MGCRGIGRNYINSTSLRKLRPSRILGLSYDMTKFRLNPKPSFNHNCPKVLSRGSFPVSLTVAQRCVRAVGTLDRPPKDCLEASPCFKYYLRDCLCELVLRRHSRYELSTWYHLLGNGEIMVMSTCT
jgi:hypothetical protein